jgi:methionyl-tRNA formyltransferase
MRLIVAGHKDRGAACLRALIDAGHVIAATIGQPGAPHDEPFAALARQLDAPFVDGDVNAPATIAALRRVNADLCVLAGFGPIVGDEFIALTPRGCINLHGGKLPDYRGSSPMNWALINGDAEFTVSIIRVDRGVDTGDVLIDRTTPIGGNDTIADLHRIANEVFPALLVEVVGQIAAGRERPRKQDTSHARYYPLRFPDDGLICWDLVTAEQAHNRIRALTTPYPGAFTFLGSRRVQLLKSRMPATPHFGEPGRVYRVSNGELLVCAADRCLWIAEAAMADGGGAAAAAVRRYDKLFTVRDQAMAALLVPAHI